MKWRDFECRGYGIVHGEKCGKLQVEPCGIATTQGRDAD